MSNDSAASPMKTLVPCRRRWLVGCGLALVACVAQDQTAAASAPRLRFRSKRAVCDCAGELDEEAIDRAQSERDGRARAEARGRAASSAASSAGAQPATTTQTPPTTTRRQAP